MFFFVSFSFQTPPQNFPKTNQKPSKSLPQTCQKLSKHFSKTYAFATFCYALLRFCYVLLRFVMFLIHFVVFCFAFGTFFYALATFCYVWLHCCYVVLRRGYIFATLRFSDMFPSPVACSDPALPWGHCALANAGTAANSVFVWLSFCFSFCFVGFSNF